MNEFHPVKIIILGSCLEPERLQLVLFFKTLQIEPSCFNLQMSEISIEHKWVCSSFVKKSITKMNKTDLNADKLLQSGSFNADNFSCTLRKRCTRAAAAYNTCLCQVQAVSGFMPQTLKT